MSGPDEAGLRARWRSLKRFRRGGSSGPLLALPPQLAPPADRRVPPMVMHAQLDMGPARHVLEQVPATAALLDPPIDPEQGPLPLGARGRAASGHRLVARTLDPMTTTRRTSPPAAPRVPAPARAPVAAPEPAPQPPGMMFDPFAGLGIERVAGPTGDGEPI